jgi:hypothetical protein
MSTVNKTKIGILEIPIEYFDLSKEEKDYLINEILNVMLTTIDKNVIPTVNRIDILNMIIDSSIETNIEDEVYEICAVLWDIKQKLNED